MRSCGGGRATGTLRQRETETEKQEQRETHRQSLTQMREMQELGCSEGSSLPQWQGTWWLGIGEQGYYCVSLRERTLYRFIVWLPG